MDTKPELPEYIIEQWDAFVKYITNESLKHAERPDDEFNQSPAVSMFYKHPDIAFTALRHDLHGVDPLMCLCSKCQIAALSMPCGDTINGVFKPMTLSEQDFVCACKTLLNMCESANGKANKSSIVICIFRIVCQNYEIVEAHPRMKKVLDEKMLEFAQEDFVPVAVASMVFYKELKRLEALS